MGCHSLPSPEDLPNPGIKPRSPELWADSLLSESMWFRLLLKVHTCLGLPWTLRFNKENLMTQEITQSPKHLSSLMSRLCGTDED